MIRCPHEVSDVAVVPALSNLRDVALQETKVGAALSSCHLVTLSSCQLRLQPFLVYNHLLLQPCYLHHLRLQRCLVGNHQNVSRCQQKAAKTLASSKWPPHFKQINIASVLLQNEK